MESSEAVSVEAAPSSVVAPISVQKDKSLRDVYLNACSALGVKPNSVLKAKLSTDPDDRQSFTTLDLSTNYVGDRGLLAVLEVVKDSPKLERFVAHENGLRNAGASAVAAALRDHPSVTEVDLSNNQISDTGAQSLLQMLASNPRIKKLDYSVNRIGVDLRLNLAKALEKNNA